MSKISKKDKELIDEFMNAFNKVEEDCKREEKTIIETINKLDSIKKELYDDEPLKIMFISHKIWKNMINKVEDNLLKLYNDLGETITEHTELFDIMKEK